MNRNQRETKCHSYELSCLLKGTGYSPVIFLLHLYLTEIYYGLFNQVPKLSGDK